MYSRTKVRCRAPPCRRPDRAGPAFDEGWWRTWDRRGRPGRTSSNSVTPLGSKCSYPRDVLELFPQVTNRFMLQNIVDCQSRSVLQRDVHGGSISEPVAGFTLKEC